MKWILNSVSSLTAVLLLLFLSGCGTMLHRPIQPTSARLGEETPSTIELKNLPEPKEKVIVAVYKFRDQTGQYKPSENGTSWSTAVTQGATTILIKALEDSKWFIPIERENVSNLLNERKIIRSSRAQYAKEGDANKNLLPPLLYAGVIFEGGIVSYDANVITGGAGIRYFGAGASGQYRQDRITVYLRAVSTSNGKILKTVYTSKTILSQALDAGLFRFVRFGRLLEAETGFTYNEPSELALTEAIEKAVFSLIVEGVKDELWELEEAREIVAKPILEYEKEKKKIPQTDIFGKKLANRRKTLGLSLASSSLQYKGDYPDPVIRTGLDIGFHFSTKPRFDFSLHYGLSRLATKNFYASDVSYLDFETTYRIFPYDMLTPFAFVSAGGITANTESRFSIGKIYPKVSIGGGLEFLVNNNVGVKASLDYNYILSDGFDEIEQGKYNDFFWRGNIGIQFYFGREIEGERQFKYKNK